MKPLGHAVVPGVMDPEPVYGIVIAAPFPAEARGRDARTRALLDPLVLGMSFPISRECEEQQDDQGHTHLHPAHDRLPVKNRNHTESQEMPNRVARPYFATITGSNSTHWVFTFFPVAIGHG